MREIARFDGCGDLNGLASAPGEAERPEARAGDLVAAQPNDVGACGLVRR